MRYQACQLTSRRRGCTVNPPMKGCLLWTVIEKSVTKEISISQYADCITVYNHRVQNISGGMTLFSLPSRRKPQSTQQSQQNDAMSNRKKPEVGNGIKTIHAVISLKVIFQKHVLHLCVFQLATEQRHSCFFLTKTSIFLHSFIQSWTHIPGTSCARCSQALHTSPFLLPLPLWGELLWLRPYSPTVT